MQANSGIRHAAGEWGDAWAGEGAGDRAGGWAPPGIREPAGIPGDAPALARPAKQARTPLTSAGPARFLGRHPLHGGGPSAASPRHGLPTGPAWDRAERKGEAGPPVDTPLAARPVKRKAEAMAPAGAGLIATLAGEALDLLLADHPLPPRPSPAALAALGGAVARLAAGFAPPECHELARQLVTRIGGVPMDTDRAAAVVGGLMAQAGAACEGQHGGTLASFVAGAVQAWCGSVAHLTVDCAQAVLRPLGARAVRVEGQPAAAGAACARLLVEALGALQLDTHPADLQRAAIAALLPPDDAAPLAGERLNLPALQALLRALPGPGRRLSAPALDLLLEHVLPADPPRPFTDRTRDAALCLLVDAVGSDTVLAPRLAGRVLGSRWADAATCNRVVERLASRLPGLAPGPGWSAFAAGRLVPSLLQLAPPKGGVIGVATAIAAALAGPQGLLMPASQARAMVVGLAGYFRCYQPPGAVQDAVQLAVRQRLLAAPEPLRETLRQGLALAGDPQAGPVAIDARAIRDAWRVLDHRDRPQVMAGLLRRAVAAPLPEAGLGALLRSLLAWSVDGQDLPQAVLGDWLDILMTSPLPLAERGDLAARLLGAAAQRPTGTLPWQWLDRARPAIAMAIAHEGPGPRRDALTQSLVAAYGRADLGEGGAPVQDWLRRELRFLARSQQLGLLAQDAIAPARATLDWWQRVLRAEDAFAVR
ncbi:hypothetical protein ACT80S_17745 [Ramlibacter sp. MAHUQ-53]|uniref:hypothetical protein n=1 Tax=unclassified Ramlibacter TaxID=2617605 RepID=UPI003633984D